ncbi:MAG: Stk1 family PASTA domain-containing Ser/Thr kinase [Ruminococcus sp.]|nr:Stk1 family PASTA domain-containing Ser/Thr kinase [Ruminococcus sp.]
MDSNIGKKLDGRYEITELIGVGGMADVYKATDVMENRTVAVKILKAEYSENEEFLRRFRNESKAIAVLSHPNIVKIYDVGFTDEIQFIVMEYIDGITLKELLEQQGVLRWKDALKFVTQILKALQHAHDKGIVHRDIKPQNIMLFPDGTIKVMDFGIARFSRIDGKTLSDKTIGSVHYISPEQAKGEMTDERSDIYSVGVMLYEMLTGRKPFDGENPVAIAVKHMQETAVPPREIMPSIPESLEEIVLHAMERSPARRYQSAAEMINDISAFKVNPSIVFGYKKDFQLDDASSTRFFKPVPDYDDDDDYEDDEDEYEDDDDDEEEEKKRSYVIPILLAVTVAVVVIAAAVIAYSVIKNFNVDQTHTSTVMVENFVGQNYLRVSQNYSDKLTFNVKEEWSSSYPQGVIIDQSVSNKTVREGFTLDVTVSKGPRMLEVPDLTNKTQSVAESELKSAGFEPNFKETFDETGTVPEGMVIRTEPAAGTQYAAGAEVIVFVSRGQFETDVKVPNVIGMTQEKAIMTLRENKLSAVVAEVNQEEDKGKVIEQSKPEGAFVPKNTEITIWVSTGEVEESEMKIPVPMPDFVYGSYIIDVYRDGNIVVSQNVDDGEAVAGGSVNVAVKGKKTETVNIWIRSNLGQVKNYATFQLDYDSRKATISGSAKIEELRRITPTTTTTTTTAETTTTTTVNTEPPAPMTSDTEPTTPSEQPIISDPSDVENEGQE